MSGYVIQVRRDPLGAGSPTFETVCVLSDTQEQAVTLVRTGLQLEGDETVQVVRALTDEEARKIGVKPFQVKHI